MTAPRRRALRVGLPVLAALTVLAPVAWWWAGSLMPDSYSAMDMGYVDYGDGPRPPVATDHAGQHQGDQHPGGHSGPLRPITELTADPQRPADVAVDLTADAARLDVGGEPQDGFTLNGSSPGPVIEAVQGQLVQVRLRNRSVPGGVTLHWHGVDVPNAEDGVAGVTQDAVPVGGEHTYRFVAEQAGTFWYHSHQVSDPQVRGGLLGGLVIRPRAGTGADHDVLAVAHTYGAVRTVNGAPGALSVPAAPGETVRLRVVNTDNQPMPVWSDGRYRVLAVDGTDLHGPGPVDGQGLVLAAGGRVDLAVTAPPRGATRVQLSRATAVVVGGAVAGADGGAGGGPVPVQPAEVLDLLSYGTPAPLGLDPARADRRFEYRIGRRPGFVRGRPGLFWSVNGRIFPDVPMYLVRPGEVVTMRITNGSSEVHPMHLHGHHAVVLSRNGVAATGSPWWVDSLDVAAGDSYEIAFRADNPGIWMSHCHNLEHATDGMVAHLAYEGWDTPFRIGGTGSNRPE